MKSILVSTITLILTTTACASSDKRAEGAIEKAFPHSKIISRTECELGKEKVKLIAVVIRKDLKNRLPNTNPLEAAIVFQDNSKPALILSRKIENSKGSDKDFLEDFWTEDSGTTTAVEIRCIRPNNDPDIKTTANGELNAGFGNQSGKHLCYQASTVYNNWACFNLNTNGDVVSSFVQLNAD